MSEAWLIAPCTAVHRKCHTSRRPPDIILRRSFTRPSTVLAVIEGLGTSLMYVHIYMYMFSYMHVTRAHNHIIFIAAKLASLSVLEHNEYMASYPGSFPVCGTRK